MEYVIMLGALVVTVLAVTAVSRRLGLLAPLALMVVGVIGSYLPFVHEPQLTPELVLVGLLPPLLYSAAVNTSLVDFRRDIAPIGWLSVGLVVFTAFGVGIVVHALLPVPFAAAVAIGAVVAPPDAVAATSVARAIGLPRRVVSILEGESLVNDATALVSLRSAVHALTAAVTVGAVLLDFGKAVLLAVLIGVAIAKLANLVFRRLRDPLITTALTFVAPFAAFAPAEELHASGVIAVVVAGLLIGHAAPIVQNAQARIAGRMNWKTVQFLLENTVFLLIGLQVRSIVAGAAGSSLGWPRIIAVCAAALAAVIVLRVLWVFATRLLVRVRGGAHTSAREALVIAWAGMRGVVTLAAALTLPASTPHRDVLVLVALVVTLGTLLIQGTTLPLLARALDVRGPDPREDTLQEAAVYQHAVTAGLAAAETAAGPDDAAALKRLRATGELRLNSVWERLGRAESEAPTPFASFRRLRQVALDAERREVIRLRDEGGAEHAVLEGVLAALDMEDATLARSAARDEALSGAHVNPQLPDSPCEHLRAAPCIVEPQTPEGCPECAADGLSPVHLRLCLTCGHVGCCDSSVGKHATAHYEATGHPVMRSFEPGESWRWCYVDELLGTAEK